MVRTPGARAARIFSTMLVVWGAIAGTLAIGARRVELAARTNALQRVERAVADALQARDPGAFVTAAEGAGAPHLELVTAERITSAFGDARVELWRRALESGRIETRRDRRFGALAAARLDSPPAGVIEATVPAAEIEAARRHFVARSLPWAALLGLAGGAIVAFLVRRATIPIERLALAAAAAARGDLSAPLPVVVDGDDGLGASVEALRRRLRETTAELGRRRFENEVVLTGVADGVYAVDRDRRIRYLSPRAAAMLETTPEAALGMFCGDLLRPSLVDGVRPCESSCPILQARFRGAVRALERIQPGEREIAAVLSSSPEAGGLQVQILSEESPDEAARRARDAVVADLAHELKTPLAAQRASLELLRDRLSAAGIADGEIAEARELAGGVEAGTFRLERLIDNLLESVRIEAGELAIRRRPVELEEVVEEAVATTAALFAKRGQRLEVDLPYPVPQITGDAPRLVQVLVNLLANAAKFAPGRSEVRVGGAISPNQVALWVEDEGPGFEARDLPRLTSRFRRGVDETGRAEAREEGSGLGLWIARSIAERHGGGLAVERHGGRTRVILLLPATESPA